MRPERDPREDPLAVAAAVERAAEALRQRNRLLGLPLVVWRDGKVQYVDAATLQPIVWPDEVHESGRLPLPPES